MHPFNQRHQSTHVSHELPTVGRDREKLPAGPVPSRHSAGRGRITAPSIAVGAAALVSATFVVASLGAGQSHGVSATQSFPAPSSAASGVGSQVASEREPRLTSVESQQHATHVSVGIDPELGVALRAERLKALDLVSLRHEGRASGSRVTRNGEVLSGRIVVDRFEVPMGTEVFIEAGTELVITGAGRLDGRITPRAAAPSMSVDDGDESAALAAALGTLEHCFGALPGTCPNIDFDVGAQGVWPGEIVILLLGDTVITDAFVGICGSIAPNQAGGSVLVPGSRSALAVGGRGGDGVDIYLIGAPGVTLLIDGPVCNARGAAGGTGHAIGIFGDPCECGGDAFARGGDGGDAGRLEIVADLILWGPGGSLTIEHGGAGGQAIADAGAGGDCFECGVEGGRGGYGMARGGAAGVGNRVSIAATVDMVPSPTVVLTSMVTIAAAPSGGLAEAYSGRGGDGGPCTACAEDGGEGGIGGDACAQGGRGADGIIVAAREPGGAAAVLGSDGGDGGGAWAYAADGGFGGAGASCPCSYVGFAGFGGNGGEGGDAFGEGGVGGRAYGGPAALALATPLSGDGGSVLGWCGFGGAGGVGGSCILDLPENCISGAGGIGGSGGIFIAEGGAPGAAGLGAVAGSPGLPASQDFFFCESGVDGAKGLVFCAQAPPCCTPSEEPGCDDPICAKQVCGIAPHCCEIQWDLLCASIANDLCVICSGGDA